MKQPPAAMRSTLVRCLAAPFSVALPLSTLACGDEAPIYPPLPTFSDGGQNSGSGNKTGNGGRGQGTGGKSQGSGGTGNTGATGAGTTGGTGQNTDDPLFAHCNEPWSGDELPPGPTQCDLDALQDGGDLTGDISADRTLESGFFYTLKGVTSVQPGTTLTIQPCVKVIGRDPQSVLVMRSGVSADVNCSFAPGAKPAPSGKLVAAGEPMAPIIFTSAKPPGSRAPGDWGGVLLLGRARHNQAKAQTVAAIEGLVNAECYGWGTDEFNGDSSGKLEFVRIEYASSESEAGKETNGLTLGAVGSGTSVHHVMVSNSADDCFEWFGGTVSGHHLIALNCEDDLFDADNSFSGNLQFLFGRQFPSSIEDDSRGFEIDSGKDTEPPRTTASWSNFTVCGGGPTDTSPREKLRAGLVLRTNAAGSLMNGMVTGFSSGGLAGIGSGLTTVLNHIRIFEVPSLLAFGHDAQAGGAAWFTSQEGNSAEDPDRFCDCWAPKPVAVAASPITGGTPTGFEDESANYVGAFKDASPDSNWMQGLWVDWSDN